VSGWQVGRFAQWLLLRAAEQVALHEIDTHVGEHPQLVFQLDAFGDHFASGGFGDFQDRVDELSLDPVLVNAVDEVAVDLHVVRAQFRPHPQARVTCTQIVQSDREAHRAVMTQGRVEQLEVFGGRLLGQLDHHALRLYAVLAKQLQCPAWPVVRV